MLKRYIFKGLDTSVISLTNVLEEVNRKSLTGFLKVTYWTGDDYLLFSDGEPYKAISFKMDGSKLIKEPGAFSIQQEGSATLAETTLDDLTAILETKQDLQTEKAWVFFPYGLPIHEPTLISFLDLEKELTLVKRSHLDGYMAFHSRETLMGMVLFERGHAIAAMARDGSLGETAIRYISSEAIPSKTFVSVYTLEPEIVNFMYSLQSAGVRTVNLDIESYDEVRTTISEESKNAVVLIESEGICRYDLFFEGQLIHRLVKDKGLFVHEDEIDKLSIKVENLPNRSIKVFEVKLVTPPKPMDIPLEISVEAKESSEVVSPEKVHLLKELFLKEIGPIGKIVWDRVLKDLGLSEERINSSKLKVFLERLKSEFPERELGESFTRKAKDLVSYVLVQR